MTRIFYDSVTVADLPPDGDGYLGYVDGPYRNYEAVRARFPGRPVASVTVTGTSDANVCDCETGDLTPSQAAGWAKRQLAAGKLPTIYCNASTWPAVKQAVATAGLTPRMGDRYLIAEYPGPGAKPDPTIPAGAIGHQYLGSPEGGSPGHYDVSVVVEYWPGVDPVPPKPARGLSPVASAALSALVWRLSKVRNPPTSHLRVRFARLLAQVNRIERLK
jgi:hypothetical protein